MKPSKKMRVAIVGAFSSFPDTYSVSRVACEQLHALAAEGVECQMWVLDTLDLDFVSPKIRDFVKPVIRPQKMLNDEVDQRRVDTYAADILTAFRDFDPTHVITHDLLFQAGHVDLAKAIHDLEPMTRTANWFHYVHSSVRGSTHNKETPIWRRSLPEAHFVLCPTQSDAPSIAKYYNTAVGRVYTCPNIHDPRSRMDVSDVVERIVMDTNLLQKDIVQILPACGTRLNAKGIEHAIALFGRFKKRGKKVLLLVANGNGGCEASIRNVAQARKLADQHKLGEDELVVTSERWPRWQDGLSQSDISDLFLLSTMFVFASYAEADSLALIEAMQSGCLCVLNQNVPGLVEHAAAGAIWADFPSAEKPLVVYDDPPVKKGRGKSMQVLTTAAYDAYVDGLAEKVLEQWSDNPVIQGRVRSLQLKSREAFLMRIFEIFRHAEAAKLPLRTARATTIRPENPHVKR